MKLAFSIAAGIAALGLSTPAPAQTPGKHHKGCKTEKGFLRNGTKLYVAGADGLKEVHGISQGTRCTNTLTKRQEFLSLHGLVDADGKELMRPVFEEVLPVSDSHAAVFYEDYWTWYDLKKGRELPDLSPKFGDLKYLKQAGACWRLSVKAPPRPVIVGAFGPATADGRRDLAVYSGSNNPMMIHGTGGNGIAAPVERVGPLLVVRWRAPDGALRSRVHDSTGRPLSPVLGETVTWSTPQRGNLRGDDAPECYGIASTDLFLVGPALDEEPAKVVAGNLLIPIGGTGAPLPLPPGAIGLFAIPSIAPDKVERKSSSGATTDDPKTMAWGVVYPTAEGWEFTMHHGSPAEAIAASPGAPRWRDMHRADFPNGMGHTDRLIAARSARGGQWSVVEAFNLQPAGTANADRTQALQIALSSILANREARVAALEREFAAARGKALAEGRAFRARMRAEGRICTFMPPWNLEMADVAEHARECPRTFNMDDERRMRSSNFPADSLASLARAQREKAMEDERWRANQEEAMRNWVPPGAWETALRMEGDRIVAQNKASLNNWLETRRQAYAREWQRAQRAY